VNLGEQIYKLRAEKNLSQGDLADLLDVSRQSISKWETNGSVPELDKLVKLGEIFGVSLDELVLDKKQSAEPETKVMYIERENAQPGKWQRTIGFAFLCLAALVWQFLCFTRYILFAPLIALLIAACGMICLRVRRFAGLWCAWVGYAVVELFLWDSIDIRLDQIVSVWLYRGNGIRLLVTWMLLLALCSMIAVTFRCLYKAYPCFLRRDGIYAVCLWAGYLLARVPFEKIAYYKVYWYDIQIYETNSCAVLYLTWRNILFAFAVVFTVRLLVALWRKCRNKN